MAYNIMKRLQLWSAERAKYRTHQREYQSLLNGSDRIFDDIGVTRMDVVRHKAKRFQFDWFGMR